MSATDNSEKTVDLVRSPAVQVMQEGDRDFIDIDIQNLQEGMFYRVEYEGDVYGIDKQSNGKLAFYEVVE